MRAAAVRNFNEPPAIAGVTVHEPDHEALAPSHEGGSTVIPGGSAVPENYPSELERDVVSDSSTQFHIRPIHPGDAQRLVDFHRHLLPRSVYLRFFNFHLELSAKEVQRFTCVDYVNRLALVAEVDDHLIAVGRFDRRPGDTEAEVAFVVSDEYQHHGIGPLLLDELVKAGRERGITTFRAETLFENHGMLDVFRHAGFPIASSTECGTVSLRFPIDSTASYRAALSDREAHRHLNGDPATPFHLSQP